MIELNPTTLICSGYKQIFIIGLFLHYTFFTLILLYNGFDESDYFGHLCVLKYHYHLLLIS